MLVEGFFSGSEIAIVSVNRSQLRHLVKKGSARAISLSRTLEKPEWLLGTTLLGTNTATITLNAIVTLYVIQSFGEEFALFTIFFTFPLMLIFGEVLPKTIFQRFADRIAPQVIFPLQLVSWVLWPLVATVALASRLFTRILGVHTDKKMPLMTREEIELVYRVSTRPKSAKDIERRMIDRIFSMSNREARDIMIPLVKLVLVREDATLEKAIERMRASGYSRLPVFSGTVFNIVGWINQYDLLFAKDLQKPVREVMRKIPFYPLFMDVDQLLIDMQKAGDTLAAVVNEHGGAIGLVTLEDVLEEVVGEIEDEYDHATLEIQRSNDGVISVSARIPILQLNEVLPHALPMGEYETLGGFLMERMQRIPRQGDEFRFEKLSFRISKATDRSVDEVEIRYSDRRVSGTRPEKNSGVHL